MKLKLQFQVNIQKLLQYNNFSCTYYHITIHRLSLHNPLTNGDVSE